MPSKANCDLKMNFWEGSLFVLFWLCLIESIYKCIMGKCLTRACKAQAYQFEPKEHPDLIPSPQLPPLLQPQKEAMDDDVTSCSSPLQLK